MLGFVCIAVIIAIFLCGKQFIQKIYHCKFSSHHCRNQLSSLILITKIRHVENSMSFYLAKEGGKRYKSSKQNLGYDY